jgi:iron(III) transport system substrate-binding protein
MRDMRSLRLSTPRPRTASAIAVAVGIAALLTPSLPAVSAATTKAKSAKPQSKATTTKPATTKPATTKPAITVAATATAAAPTPTVRSKKLVVYSGRAERLVKPLLDNFEFETGIQLEVRYADSSQLAATLIEEGSRTKAAVFFSQDAGALGALSKRNLLAPLPSSILSAVPTQYRSAKGEWVGVSGRARVFLVDPRQVQVAPDTVDALLDPKWKGKIGFAPTNSSWHSFVTALRVVKGESGAKAWLAAFKANNPRSYGGNALVVQAAERGDIAIGLVNHYYVYELAAGDLAKVSVRNEFAKPGDPGSLVNVAGVGVLKGSANDSAATELVDYLLSKEAQQFFARRTFEYPLISSVRAASELPPLRNLGSPVGDLSDLDTIDESLKMLREVGLL